MELENDEIRKCSCDGCGARGLVVVLNHFGVEVLALCRFCAPGNFERVARRNIDEWLGADSRNFGIS